MTRFDEQPVVPHQRPVQPRVWRSRDNRVVAGVVGGLAERMNVNPTVLRWFTAFATVSTGFFPFVLIYLILWAITSPYPSGTPER